MGSIPEPCDLLPPGAWDSHVHVVDEERFPFDPQHLYRPSKASCNDLQTFHKRIGISHSCLVAVSVYGTDSRSILDALAELRRDGSTHRAVVSIDPNTISEEELHDLHDAGVRGVRMNLHTRGASIDSRTLCLVADRIRGLNWILQLYVSLKQMPELAPLLPHLRVTVVLDHLAEPDENMGHGRRQTGYPELLQQLKQGTVYTKLSGTYRFSSLPDLDEYVVEILRTAPDRVVWASDWPHTGGVKGNPQGDRKKVQDYRQIDDEAWVAKCRLWCSVAARGDQEVASMLAQKIWVENPRRLWQADKSCLS